MSSTTRSPSCWPTWSTPSRSWRRGPPPAPGAGGPPDEVLAALDEARQAGRRISLIVRELTSFSRDESSADLGPTDLVEVLTHAERLAGPEIRRHAHLIVALPPGPVLVQGHQARLGLAFLELLHGASAAVAAAGRPEGLVTLALRPEPDGAVVPLPGGRGTALHGAQTRNLVGRRGGRCSDDCDR